MSNIQIPILILSFAVVVALVLIMKMQRAIRILAHNNNKLSNQVSSLHARIRQLEAYSKINITVLDSKGKNSRG